MARQGSFGKLRTGDWERALSAYLAECEGRPYAYGEHDCGLFAAGAVLAMTGSDPAEPFRGRYCSKWSAAEALRDHGAGTLEATLDGLFPEVPIGFARRGDLAWHEGSVGVVYGAVALFVGDVDGAARLIKVPRAAWEKAWAV